MNISKIVEEGARAPLALANVRLWTPAGWGSSYERSWAVEADAALRALFPNLPETIEGPWGKLPRSDVFGPPEASSALLDVLQCAAVELGGAIDPLFEHAMHEPSRQALAARVEAGKLALGEGLAAYELGSFSEVAALEVRPPPALFKGERRECRRKLSALLSALDDRVREWVPQAVSLADARLLSAAELDEAHARAEAARLASSLPAAAPKAARAKGL